MNRKLCAIVVLMLTLSPMSVAFGQQADATIVNSAAQYHLGDKDQILMTVNVWGYVQKPGQYVVPRNTDLISLISFAGGPIDGADLAKVSIIRGGEQSLAYNGHDATNGRSQKVPIIEANVKESLKTGEIWNIPILQAGDTVLIPQSRGHKIKGFFGLNSMFSVIAAFASVVVIMDRLAN